MDARYDPSSNSPLAEWLSLQTTSRPNVHVMRFAERHIGNPFIRALHGGVVGSVIELAAERDLTRRASGKRAETVAVSIDYLRVTKDADLFARVEAIRIARRVAFLEVCCWQDDELSPVARGKVTLRLFDDLPGGRG
jgi:uncharacterized protein (TIGR00369 family)